MAHEVLVIFLLVEKKIFFLVVQGGLPPPPPLSGPTTTLSKYSQNIFGDENTKNNSIFLFIYYLSGTCIPPHPLSYLVVDRTK